jgi:hypothetical protein
VEHLSEIASIIRTHLYDQVPFLGHIGFGKLISPQSQRPYASALDLLQLAHVGRRGGRVMQA